MADRDTLVPILTFGDDRDAVERLVAAVTAAIEHHRGARPRPVGSSAVWRLRTEAVLPPREAHFASHQRVPAAQAIGRVSAETVAPYPPGIPAICPGELVTAELVEALPDGGRGRHPDGLLRGRHAGDAGGGHGVTAVYTSVWE